jgi:Na+/H+-dicarboxylate symporter
MNNNKITVPIQNAKEINENFFQYTLEVMADIFLGIILGVAVNYCADYVGHVFGLKNRIGILIIQIIFICIVLYIMKTRSKYLYQSWRGATSYSIIFTTVFLAVQKNMVDFFQYIYVEE